MTQRETKANIDAKDRAAAPKWAAMRKEIRRGDRDESGNALNDRARRTDKHFGRI